MTDLDGGVVEAHARAHAWLEDNAYQTIEALVQLRIDDATRTFEHLSRVLREHMAFEDQDVLPLYKTIAPADGPGRADHVDGDHVILLRHVDAIGALLGELAERTGSVSLRDVVTRLPVVYRLVATLEHHTAREQANVYPAVARVLRDDDARREKIRQALLDLIPPA